MAWSNARTRGLLRGLRYPHILRNESAIAALRRRYGVDDDGKALVCAVNAALAGDPALREIVYRCDLRGEDTRSVAHALHFSERQFHRYRSFAIEAVAAEIERAITADSDMAADLQLVAAISAVDPERANALLQHVPGATQLERLSALRVKFETGALLSDADLAGLDVPYRLHAEVLRAVGFENAGEHAQAERLVVQLRERLHRPSTAALRRAAFELCILRRVQARRRGRTDEAAAAVDDMAAHAIDDRLAAQLTTARAHLAIHDAGIEDWRDRLAAMQRVARSSRDVRLLRYVTMVEGYLAYVHGDPERALRESVIATMAGAVPALALQSEALHARAALALGEPWSRPAWTRAVLPKVWFQAELDALGAFHALRAGDATAAGELATQARGHPAAAFAPSIVTYAAAVSAAINAEPAAAGDPPADLLVATDLHVLHAGLPARAAKPASRRG